MPGNDGQTNGADVIVVLRSRRCACGRSTGVLLAAVAMLRISVATADQIVLIDGTTRTGEITAYDGGTLQFDPAGEAPAEAIMAASLRTMGLVPPDWSSPQGMLVVDNEGATGVQEKSGKIKLKSGFHRFTLPYWHATGTPTLELQYEGPGVPKTIVQRDLLFQLADTEIDPGFTGELDADGALQPESPTKTNQSIAWRTATWKSSRDVRSVHDIRMQPVQATGRAPMIHAGVGPQDQPFAIVYSGYFKVPSDGEYTFHLKSDGGSQLHIGSEPRWLLPVVKGPGPNDWKATLSHGGELRAAVTGWDTSGVTFAVRIDGDPLAVTVPRAALQELWTTPVVDGKVKVDRTDESSSADSVYATNATGQVQRVAGTILGIQQDALQFLYQEAERSIKLDRVVGIVLRRDDAPPAGDMHFLMQLPGGHRLPLYWRSVDAERAHLETVWGAPLTVPRGWIGKLDVVNGNLRWLSDLQPARVEQTPWFDRTIPFRKDVATSGGALRIDQQEFDRGLCVHSRSVLEYDLAAGYERFRCQLGLQRPEGELGNAAVRVLVDGDVLLDVPSVTAQSAVQAIDLDVTRRSTLTLEVDFGEHYDVGDHVVFADAYLLKSAAPPTSDTPRAIQEVRP